MSFWRKYVPVAQRRAKAKREIKGLLKKGQTPQPVSVEGRAMATSFWGKAWCDHLESFSDYSNRLPRGRTYARNGSICHLEISSGRIDAIVSGSNLYEISITITPLPRDRWNAIVQKAAGGIGSVIELLRGELSHEVMRLVTDKSEGLFPKPAEIKLKCSCPDWADLCKHLAAVLYGVGNRLDTRPDLLFLLRGVDPQELISTSIALPDSARATHAIPDSALSGLFGITLDLTPPTENVAPKSLRSRPVATARKVTPTPRNPARRVKPITGPAIQRLRKRLGMTPEAFAKTLGVSLASVLRWEQIAGEVRLHAASRAALETLVSQPKVPRKIKP
ncbi:MAG: SWIM zinc finger family protein [Candidatus Hydrogenedentes bacterium]|nr:SWIM zinc finger family protein [Candidatus Hydrogenedentota bacterium]